jgi:hypothetical protein
MLADGTPRVGHGESPILSDKIKMPSMIGAAIGMDSPAH